ncbi:hypothetical protein [Hydrogenoanaerobacterium sp.]|uniref:hypothetical protein n=1 Tax=Hydrogenoanaerobacterium sp. TaxID=2953763 RepID=UPI00289C1436|nr:hypothetical protein [Hydrogenoanaerobacterium sp.]
MKNITIIIIALVLALVTGCKSVQAKPFAPYSSSCRDCYVSVSTTMQMTVSIYSI